MDAKELFNKCLASATSAVRLVGPNDFDKPTPDTEWDVRTLAGHVLYELSWTADIVRDATIEQVGNRYDGDLIGDKLLINWELAATAAQEAIKACDLSAIAHLSYGNVTVGDYLREAASDQLIHSWDLSAALGQPVQFDAKVAQAVYDDVLPKAPGMASSGLFAVPLDVPDNAGIQTKLLAIFGRDANWQP